MFCNNVNIGYNYNVSNKQHIYNLWLTSNVHLICYYNVTNKQDTYSASLLEMQYEQDIQWLNCKFYIYK